MKARIKKTGEIVDVISYGGDTVRDKNDYVSYIDSNGVEHVHVPMNYYWDVEEIDESANAARIDWEQRRYEIAKEAVRGVALNDDEFTHIEIKTTVKNAVKLADALIAELKKGCEQ